MRTSAAHVSRGRSRHLPRRQLAIGPAIDNGFYYDFELPRSLSPRRSEQIEARMRQHIKARGSSVAK